MKLVLTKKAAAQLLQLLPLADEEVIRLDARVKGGCGLSVEFGIVLDAPRPNDRVIRCQRGINISLDRFTERSLPDAPVIDCRNAIFTVTGSVQSNECS